MTHGSSVSVVVFLVCVHVHVCVVHLLSLHEQIHLNYISRILHFLSLSLCPHMLQDGHHCSCTQEGKGELNDYRPVALTSVIMKCFERLVKDHITSTLPAPLDPLQFAYHPNRCTDNAIAITLHTALSHLDKRDTYIRMLFIDYCSAFNTIVPAKLIIKLEALGLNPTLCNWVLNSGAPQGYIHP